MSQTDRSVGVDIPSDGAGRYATRYFFAFLVARLEAYIFTCHGKKKKSG